jgi:hypothetical protein
MRSIGQPPVQAVTQRIAHHRMPLCMVAATLMSALMPGMTAVHAQTQTLPKTSAARTAQPGTALQLDTAVITTAADAGPHFNFGRGNGKNWAVNLALAAPGLVPARFSIVSATRNGIASFVSANLSVSALGELQWQDISPGNYGLWQFKLQATDAAGRRRDVLVPVDIRLPPDTPLPCEPVAQPWCGFVLERWAQQQASGNLGDFYNNRDNGHATFPVATWSRQLRALPGGNATLLSPWPTRNVAGNASVFYQGPLAANMERFVSFSEAEFVAKVRVYESNHVFWYPAHTDIFGNGDLFHYNAAYTNTTVGSSGSELDQVGNTFIAWAALRPDVKMRLVERGLLAPITQMLLRRNRVDSDADYLTGAAHPSGMSAIPAAVAERKRLELAQAANKITVQDIPPLAKLRVVSEDFSPADREQLATNAWGVHRVWRREEGQREIVLSAEDSVDLNGRPLQFHWAVLRGNQWVKIEPLDQSRRARLRLTYPQRYQFAPVQPGGQTNWTTRLDVGLFAHNGAWYSPPAIFTVYALDGETRSYEQTGRLLGIKPSGREDHPRLK